MTGLILIALAGLSMQQGAPHPSTANAYQAPVIRPFEPGPDFDREQAQGDVEAERRRRPLERSVTVEAYARSYELASSDIEAAYEQGVIAAEARADQESGRLNGIWRIVDADGRARYDLVLNDPGVGPAEGGWRNGSGRGAATSDGATLMLEGAGVLKLERTGSGWRGVLTADGQSQPVSLVRPD